MEWTHGFFSVSHTTHHTPHTTPHTHHTTYTQDTTYHNTPQQHDHNTSRKQRQTETDRDRQRQTETDRDRERDRERRQRQKEKRREKIHFQCGGAWLFFVDLNRVNYDSSFISFSALGRSTVFYYLRIKFSMQLQFFLDYAVTVSKFSELFSYAATFFLQELILHKHSVEG